MMDARVKTDYLQPRFYRAPEVILGQTYSTQGRSPQSCIHWGPIRHLLPTSERPRKSNSYGECVDRVGSYSKQDLAAHTARFPIVSTLAPVSKLENSVFSWLHLYILPCFKSMDLRKCTKCDGAPPSIGFLLAR